MTAHRKAAPLFWCLACAPAEMFHSFPRPTGLPGATCDCLHTAPCRRSGWPVGLLQLSAGRRRPERSPQAVTYHSPAYPHRSAAGRGHLPAISGKKSYDLIIAKPFLKNNRPLEGRPGGNSHSFHCFAIKNVIQWSYLRKHRIFCHNIGKKRETIGL